VDPAAASYPYRGPAEWQAPIGASLDSVIDPEVGMSIIDVGLVYGVDASDTARIAPQRCGDRPLPPDAGRRGAARANRRGKTAHDAPAHRGRAASHLAHRGRAASHLMRINVLAHRVHTIGALQMNLQSTTRNAS
jgi:hypothetical protein